MESSQQYLKYIEEAIERPGIESLVDWLENETDFFVSPASTRFHGSYEGGLCEHSLNVYEQMLFEMDTLVGPNWEALYDPESVAIIALFHDLCKVNRYMIDTRWRKDADGQWESYEAYVYNPEKVDMGHGAQSVFYIQQFIRLTEQEAQAIFWHMSAFDISPYANLNGLSSATEKNPLAFLIQRADMAATYAIENKNFQFSDREVPGEAPVEEVAETEEVPETKITRRKKVEPKEEPKGKIIKKSEPAKEEPVEEPAEEPKVEKTGSGIRVPRKLETVEEVQAEEETVAEEHEEVVEVETYWYDEKEEYAFIVGVGEELPPVDDTHITEITEEEYVEIMFPILDEDFFYSLPDGTVGNVAKGERLPEDYDEETFVPILEEEYIERSKPKEEPTVTAKASRKTPTPKRRPRP